MKKLLCAALTVWFASFLFCAFPSDARSATVPDDVRLAIQRDGSADCLIVLTDQADLSPANRLVTRESKARWVFDTLRNTADTSQRSLRAQLDQVQVPYRAFWIRNMLQARLDSDLLERIASREDVRDILLNRRVRAIDPTEINAEPAGRERAVEWNITQIRASDVWAEFGVRGEGIVLCDHDTGVDWEHPALQPSYRGWNGSTADHNYNWFDATGTSATVPLDDNGHGTHTTGTMVGDDGGSNQIGVAPGAKWIAVKCMDAEGSGEAAWFHAGFQWILAPTDLTGANPDPAKAPHAINNSWGFPGGDDQFQDDIDALIAAGIFVEVSAGNEGTACYTLRSPGDYENVFTTGSTNRGGLLSAFSSRGPSVLTLVAKPDVVAPGSNVRSAVPGGTYGAGSGTSMAGPHVTGMIALLWSANPALEGDIPSTVAVIRASAWATDTNECGPSDDRSIPNNAYGSGEIDCYLAVRDVLEPVSQGRMFLNRAAFACESFIGIQVADSDLTGTGTLIVGIRSTTETTSEPVTLTETVAGMFAGVMAIVEGTAAADGSLQVHHGDTITVTYHDADHGGSPGDVTETATVDCIPPAITNLTVQSVTSTSVTVSWTTDEPATTIVQYGDTMPLAGVFEQTRLATSHSVMMTGLSECTTYQYWIGSADEALNLTTDDNGGSNYSVKTFKRFVALNESMDSDPGWTITGGAWAWGTPTGQAGDPTNGRTGNSVYGYNLNGAYENNMPVYALESPVIDCSAGIGTTLYLSLWLNVDSAARDHAAWDVSTDAGSTWMTLWQNENYPMVMDFWFDVEAPVGGLLDGESQVKFRWTMGPTDSTVAMGGWNIDDFRVEFDADCDYVPPTPTPSHELGVRLELPEMAHPGEPFRVTGYLDNPDAPRENVPVFFVLDVFGDYWFWPSWVHYVPGTSTVDFAFRDLPTGTTTEIVIPEFVWPDTGSATVTDLRFLGAMLTPDMAAIMGELAVAEFGYSP